MDTTRDAVNLGGGGELEVHGIGSYGLFLLCGHISPSVGEFAVATSSK